ncbi:MAG: FAD-binding protein [Coriobacteriales bacterium]|nr:FAD-binding protein [Coriobacteriales bacterium]
MELNRRQFLQAAGAAAATAAVAGMASTAVADEAEVMTAEKADATKWSFEIAPDPIPEDQISQVIEHDFVIVGAGMAGVCTAVAAAEEGCDVIVVTASSTAISRGGSNHAIGSKYQIEKGIDYNPEVARKIVKAEQTAGTYFMDKKKWARWINHSAESINWTIDLMEGKGLKCCLEPGFPDPDGIIDVPPASHNFYTDEQPFGALWGAPIEARTYAQILTEDLGCEIHYNTIAKQLVREDNNTGRVSAVIAQDSDGNYIKYVANKAIVLATGDFSRDRDMMRRYSPVAYEWFKDQLDFETLNYDIELAYNGLMPGDGQKMGLWIGAAWQKTYPVAPMINGGASGPAHGVISNFWGLNMDIHGERYMNEVTNFSYGAMAKLMLPEQTAYSVWDVNYAYTQDSWERFGCCIDLENGIMPSTPEEIIASWDKSAEAGESAGIAATSVYWKADTIEELVEKMTGIDKEKALETIKKYNEYAKNGLDEEFHVNPEVLYPIENGPFYATKSKGATFLTVCGGLRTNDKMQVCDENDQPIPGLYNTGIMTGDFYANSYNFVMPGQNLGAVCGTLSYLLGKDLAQL